MGNTLTFANRTLTDADIYGGVTYIADLNTGEEFSIGNTASSSLRFITDVQLPLYSKDQTNGVFDWRKNVSGGPVMTESDEPLLLNNDSLVWEQGTDSGRYYITDVTKAGGRYTVTAYDAMILLDVSISALSLTFPLSVSAAASAIATYLGCSLSGTILNGTLTASEDDLDDGTTIRQLLSYVAEASGCSVKISGNSLCFVYYADSEITITATDYKTLEAADYTCAAIDNVQIFDFAGMVKATAGSGTNTLFVQCNPFLYGATDTEAAVILGAVGSFVYTPVVAEMFGTEGLDIGVGATFGTAYTLVMHIESSDEEGTTISSVGSDSRAELNKSVEVIANEAKNVATKLNQHFWYEASGAEAGAHIAEISKAEFDTSPSGGNLKATSQGIYIRDGMTNLATFGADGLDVYKNGSSIAQFGADVRLGASSNNATFSYDSAGSIFSLALKLASAIKGKIELHSSFLKISTKGTSNFNEPSAIWLQNEIGSGNTRYGAIDITAKKANGNSYNVRVAPTGITASAVAKVLWSGASYMGEGQSVDLSETVSEQLCGIVLVWSRYASGAAQNDSWSYDFVPKWHTIYHDGGGVYCSMPTGTKTNTVCNKYVYVYDMSVEGHADNTATGTGYANNTRVLRSVLGV